MKKNKLVALVIACAMATTTMLSGCGQETKQSSEQKSESVSSEEKLAESSASQSEAEKEPELEPYTVTYWMYGDESKDHELVLEKMNERIQETLPNTTLEVVYVASSEYADRWTKALAAGEKIDLGWAASWVNDPRIDTNQGVLLPLNELMEEYGQGIIDELGWKFIDMHQHTDGDYYFLPSWQYSVNGRAGIVMLKEIVDLMPQGWLENVQNVFWSSNDFTREAKEPRVKLMNEYLETAAANDLIGDGLRFNTATITCSSIFSANEIWRYNSVAYVDENDGVYTVDSYYGSDAVRYLCETAADWYQKGYIRSDVASAETSDTYKYILHGTQAVENNWLDAVNNNIGNQVFYGVTVQPDNKMCSGWDTGTVIPYTSENPERAMQVLNLLYSDAELYRLLVYGIPGTHYTLNEDGTITLPNEDERTYKGPDNWMVGTCMNSLYEADNAGQENYAELKELEATAEDNPLVGFIFDTSKVSNEVANCNAVKGEYQPILLRGYYGAKWEACYNEFIKKLDDAGLQKILDELRSQLKVYVEANGLGTVAE